MNDALYEHIFRTFRADARVDLALAAGSLIAGLAVLTLSFYVAFVIIWMLLFLLPFAVSDESLWSYLGSAVFLAIVFFESWRHQRKLFEGYTDEHSAGGAALSAGLYLLGVGWGPRGIIPLSSGTSRNTVRVCADLLYSGPRLLRNAVRLIRRSRARGAADPEECSRVLAMALDTNGRLTFDEITAAQAGIHLPTVLEQLSWLGGIVYLQRDPAGITLTDSLRQKLEEVVRVREE